MTEPAGVNSYYWHTSRTQYPIKAVGKVNRTGEVEGFLLFGRAAC